MSIFKELVLTSLPAQEVAGNEGLVDSIINVVRTIVKKVIDGVKWLWGLITGKGSGGSNNSVPEASVKITKGVNDYKKVVQLTDTQIEKIRRDADAVLREADKVLDNSHEDKTPPNLKEGLSQLKTSKTKDERRAAVKLMFTPSFIKKSEDDVIKLRKDNGISSTTPAAKKKVKEVVSDVLVAAATHTPTPRKKIEDRTGSIDAGNLWCGVNEATIKAGTDKSTSPDDPVDVQLVNHAITENLNIFKLQLLKELGRLEKLKVLTVAEVLNLSESDVTACVEAVVKDIDGEVVDLSGGASITKKIAVGDNGMSVYKKEYKKGTSKASPFYLGLNYASFQIIGKGVGEIVPTITKIQSLIKTLNNKLSSVDGELGKMDGNSDGNKKVAKMFSLLQAQFRSSSDVIASLSLKILHLEDIASSPEGHLE